jgi:hypothetical protein
LIIAEVSRRSVELFSSRILSETKITLRDLRNELTGKIFEISIKYNKSPETLFFSIIYIVSYFQKIRRNQICFDKSTKPYVINKVLNEHVTISQQD